MADANQLAAALQYQQELEAAARPQMMNPNIAEQGRKGRANMAPPTSVMDPRSRDYERRSRETENFLAGADILAGALPFAPLAKGAVMAAGRYAGPKIAQGLEQHLVNTGGILPMDVYHGSPYKFDKFDMSKIGTGEGAQAYGHGLYFAENPSVASQYKADRSYVGKVMNGTPDNTPWDASRVAKQAADIHGDQAVPFLQRVLKQNSMLKAPGQAESNKEVADAIALLQNGQVKGTASLYRVDLPDEHIAKMLDWDKPLSKQPGNVRDALMSLDVPFGGFKDSPAQVAKFNAGVSPDMAVKYPDASGQSIYTELAGRLGGQSAFSQKLREMGVPGIRYLDGGSRTGGAGTSNFVVFNDTLPKIIGRE